jgi:hypothetical protein
VEEANKWWMSTVAVATKAKEDEMVMVANAMLQLRDDSR